MYDSFVKILWIQRLEKLLADKRITLALDEAAIQWLAAEGYDPIYGARPLKRVIQKKLQDKLAMQILSGTIKDGDHVTVSAHDLGLHIAVEGSAAA